MSKTLSPGARFRKALKENHPLQIVGTINAYTAMMAEKVGHQAIYLSGGGVANACLSGREAGRVAAAATEASDFSEEFLQAYERGWREEMEDRLYHSYLAKTKLTEIEPEMIDAVVATMVKVGVDEPTVQGILEVLEEHHPEILEKVGAML